VLSLAAAACSSAPESPAAQSPDAAPGDASTNDASSVTPKDAAADGPLGPTDSAADAPDAPAPTCGPAPARYTLLTGADASLVRDNVTDLVWMNDSVGGGEPPQVQTAAATYCTNRGMRLPTKAEALALATAYASCAFGQWSTWTSTTITGGDAWVVDYLGESSPQVADNFPSAVLCVRDPGGD